MKILHILSCVDPTQGGIVSSVLESSLVLREMGHEIEIASLDDPQASYVKACPFPVHACGPTISYYAYAPRFVPWLRENAAHYDVSIINGLWQFHAFGSWLALAKMRHDAKRGDLKAPYFVFPHGMLDPYFKRVHPLKHLRKLLIWRWGEYRVLRDARAVCFTCEQERLLARESFRPYRCRETVVTLGTAAPPESGEWYRHRFLQRFPHLENRRFLLFLSRIHPKKGCDLLLQAFASQAARDPQLDLVMAGPEQVGWGKELQEMAQRLGIAERVHWPGMIQGDEKWGAYFAAEAFVLPSHQENFGIVVAEALSCGTPVLISDQVNIWREIESYGAGLVAPDTLEGTVKMLQQWLNLAPEAREDMKHCAQKCFRHRFEAHAAALSLLGALGAPDAAPSG